MESQRLELMLRILLPLNSRAFGIMPLFVRPEAVATVLRVLHLATVTGPVKLRSIGPDRFKNLR